MRRPRRRSVLMLFVRYLLLALGAFISAIAVLVFEAPANIAPGGVSGIAIILNHVIGTPIGLVILIGNIPIQLLAFRLMGGWQIVVRTIFAVVLYSIMIDTLTPFFPADGITGDTLLNALMGGVLTGVGSMIIIRGGGTLGGTSTLGRILQARYGIPLGSSVVYTDGAVVIAAGIVFGWEGALYAMVALYVAGAATDYFLEGPATIRTGVIITDHPRAVADAILDEMGRGVTAWEGKGMFTDQAHTVLYVTVNRGQINQLRTLVLEADPAAFMVVGQGHSAYGRGFRPVRHENALPLEL
ncbi:MAG: YitT family protein [bacterium]|nr:YitT family protein [bacterium]